MYIGLVVSHYQLSKKKLDLLFFVGYDFVTYCVDWLHWEMRCNVLILRSWNGPAKP